MRKFFLLFCIASMLFLSSCSMQESGGAGETEGKLKVNTSAGGQQLSSGNNQGAEDQVDTSSKESLGTADLAEIDRRLNNPLTDLWSLTFQNNTNFNSGDAVDGTEVSNNLFFQPFMPFAVGENKEMMFTLRPVFPLVTNPVFGDPGSGKSTDHDTGLGDVQLLNLMGPNRRDGWVWGVGSTHKFPTATEDTLGADKYQAGPAGMLFYMGKPWVIGVLAQHWWSYAGDGDEPETSRTDLQYVIRRSLPDAWSIGMGPTVVVDWKADSDNQLTLPVGLGLTKTVRWGKLPVKLRWEAHYSVITPDDYGSEWVLRFQFTPVIPNPFR
ncbi:MAG: hypothetical protein ACYSSP_01420 [Planctomycetota bacterium]|jgi:hypothetical protein